MPESRSYGDPPAIVDLYPHGDVWSTDDGGASDPDLGETYIRLDVVATTKGLSIDAADRALSEIAADIREEFFGDA